MAKWPSPTGLRGFRPRHRTVETAGCGD